MKTMLWILLLLLSSKEISAQIAIPSKRTYRYSKDTVNYYFYLNSPTDQSLTWGYIYGYEKCFVHIVNNTNETLSLGKIGVTSHPIYWFFIGNSQNDFVAPNDTIHLRAHLARRHGGFNRPINIQYQTISNPGKIQRLNIPTKGFYIDSAQLKRNHDLQHPNESYERMEFLKTHYENGQVKEVKNTNPVHDSIPIKIAFYENGKPKVIEYRGKGTVKKAYDQDGNLKNTWEDNGDRTEYYSNGNIKFKSGNDHFSATVPFQTYYFENGCLKKEVFLNNSIIKEYDSVQCNHLISKTIKDSTVYNNSVAYYEGGKITKIVFYAYSKAKQRVEHVGTFDGYQIKNGFVNYYSSNGSLLFSSQIKDGKIDAILSSNEKQGNQINLHDELGRKTGLWIMQKTNDAVPIAIPYDLHKTLSDARDFAWRNYSYDKGDTALIVYLYDYGGVKSKEYLKDKDYRIRQGKETGIGFHENGFLEYKSYELKNGTHVVVNYSDKVENQITEGRRGNRSQLIYENNKLVEIISIHEVPKLDVYASSNESNSISTLQDGMSVVEKGVFKNFELYNGFIYYYDKSGKRLLTEQVTQGIIQGNPRINLTEEVLIAVARRNDLNMNGYIEGREVRNLTSISLVIVENHLSTFKWYELAQFKKLEVFNCNGLTYRMSDYSNLTLLKNAVIAKKGAVIGRERNPYDWEPMPVPPFPPVIERQVVDIPDVEASFPGGVTALYQWIDSNLVYPVSAPDGSQGKVYVDFIVEQDGSISNVKVVKGVCQELDREAKQLVRRMPKWEPAIYKGKVCASRLRLPIVFRLK